jgi:2-oxoglutarate dehydrogenase E2 component (dihydrolipoamide succinyltransferase)
MASEIRVPALGESVVEATVAEWLKKEGEAVNTGDVVVRLETDKVDVEVSAEQDGVLAQILRQKGEDVQVGDSLGVIALLAPPPDHRAPAWSKPSKPPPCSPPSTRST